MAAEFVVQSGRVEATAVTENQIAGPLTVSIDSIYSNLKVPARPINAKHILRLLLRTVKIGTNKLFIDYTVTLNK